MAATHKRQLAGSAKTDRRLLHVIACAPAGTTVDIGSNSPETVFRLVVVVGPHPNITAPAPTVARVGGATQSRGESPCTDGSTRAAARSHIVETRPHKRQRGPHRDSCPQMSSMGLLRLLVKSVAHPVERGNASPRRLHSVPSSPMHTVSTVPHTESWWLKRNRRRLCILGIFSYSTSYT
jgi:hypothetical protein